MRAQRHTTTLAAALLLALTACSEPGPQPNVVLVVVDALRADHLSLYGYPRPTSPHLEAFAASGVTFERHLSHASHTVPATVSLLTSQTPAEHGYSHPHGGSFLKSPPVLREDLTTLAEVFASAGYATAAFVANPFLKSKNRFDQGFAEYSFHPESGAALNRLALEWLGVRAENDPPFFLYLHYMDVHNPYQAPESYRGRFRPPPGGRLRYRNGLVPGLEARDLAATIAAYDEQIPVVDDLFQALLDALDRSGLRRDTIVVFTSDHGDEFAEHGGLGHGTTVYAELLHVPLVISYPPALEAGRRVRHRSRHLDLAPSLLALAGLEKPVSFRGSSVFDVPDAIYAEDGPWVAAHGPGGKLIVNTRAGSSRVFRDGDALDREPVKDAELEAELLALLRPYILQRSAPRAATGAPAVEWTEDEAAQLRALGYAEPLP